MRALVVHDSDGKVVSATIVHAGHDMGEVSPALSVGHRLTEVDIDNLIESERKASKSENEAVARALSRLMMGSAESAR